MLCTMVPIGMDASCMALPGFTSRLDAGDDRVADGEALRRQDVGERTS
jgi:hypothetical protein